MGPASYDTGSREAAKLPVFCGTHYKAPGSAKAVAMHPSGNSFAQRQFAEKLPILFSWSLANGLEKGRLRALLMVGLLRSWLVPSVTVVVAASRLIASTVHVAAAKQSDGV